jgi:serine/threonine protein phosphatase PrpC
MIVISDKILTWANVGDSRWIMAIIENENRDTNNNGYSVEGEENNNEIWKVIVLSRDHKPEFESERKRILSFGGRVEALFDTETRKQLGPYRVWLKDENVPGLAMSRSMGDEVARKAGVVWDPEIREIELEKQDKFIVQASDGLWEFMSNKEVIDIVIPYWKRNDPTSAWESLSLEATKRWKSSDAKTIDDISIIVIFLNVW